MVILFGVGIHAKTCYDLVSGYGNPMARWMESHPGVTITDIGYKLLDRYGGPKDRYNELFHIFYEC